MKINHFLVAALLSAVLAGAALGETTAPKSAGATAQPSEDQLVNLNLHNAIITEAIQKVFFFAPKSTDSVTVGSIPNSGTFSLKLTNEPFDSAVDKLCKAAGIGCARELVGSRHLYIFYRSADKASGTANSVGLSGPLVDLDLQDVTVFDALVALFKNQPNNWESSVSTLSTPTISLKFSGTPFSQAVDALARSAGLSWSTDEKGKYHFYPYDQEPAKTQSGKFGGRLSPGTINIAPTNTGRTYDVTLENANLLEAVKQLLDIARMDYVLGATNPGQGSLTNATTITAKIRHATLDDALNFISKASGLTIQRSGKTYIIHSISVSGSPNGMPSH